MEEIWKDINGYEGLYQVSNFGRVKSLNYNHTKKEEIMTLTPTKRNYMKIHLDKDGKRKYFTIHRLVAQAFIPNPNNYNMVLHKKAVLDGGTNSVDNLYWGNNSDNMKDRTRDGHFVNPRKGKFGKENPTSKSVLQFDLDNNLIKKYESITQASNETNINNTNISQCCKGYKYRKTAGCYIWRYENE